MAGGATPFRPGQRLEIGAATLEVRPLTEHALPSEEAPRERKYEVGQMIACGGMGAVLAARQSAIPREVAMKVMLPESRGDDHRRFILEAQITGQFEHPNIVPVHELAVDEHGQPYYTMKLVRGITLKKVIGLLAEGVAATVKKYPLPALLTIFQKVCDALAFAHPLARLPIKVLKADRTNVTSLEPLRGCPLEELVFFQTRVADVSPLLDCPKLREVVLPDTVKNVEVLRQHPSLKRFSRKAINPPQGYGSAQTAAEFWAEYDAPQAAGKK